MNIIMKRLSRFDLSLAESPEWSGLEFACARLFLTIFSICIIVVTVGASGAEHSMSADMF